MAVKNLVITEHAYKIDIDPHNKFATCACPRCGHVQERKPRSICESCKRFIPHDSSRQRWDEGSTARDPYTAQFIRENIVQAEDCHFKVARGKRVELVRAVREFGIFFVILAVVYCSTPWVLQAAIGKAGVERLTRSINTTILVCCGLYHPNHKIASKKVM